MKILRNMMVGRSNNFLKTYSLILGFTYLLLTVRFYLCYFLLTTDRHFISMND